MYGVIMKHITTIPIAFLAAGALATSVSAQGISGDLSKWVAYSGEVGTGDADDSSQEEFWTLGGEARVAYDIGGVTVQGDILIWKDFVEEPEADDDQHLHSEMVALHVGKTLSNGITIGGFAGYGWVETVDDHPGTFYLGGIEARKSFGAITVSGQLGMGDTEQPENPNDIELLEQFTFANIEVAYALNASSEITGSLGYIGGLTQDAQTDMMTYGIEYEYFLSSYPMTLFGGFSGISASSDQDGDPTTVDSQMVYIGARYAFGGAASNHGSDLWSMAPVHRYVGLGQRFD